MGILGTSANVTAMSNVSGSIGNVNTVATNLSGITAFSSVYSSGSNDPSSNLNEGDLFFNTSSDVLKVYNGSAWVVGVTAGSGFLPLAGGQLSGNLTMAGSQTVDGRDLSADGSKLDGIEASATADQSNAEIRAAVEAATDSNVFTDADHTKLNGIEASATADQSNAEIRTAVEAATDSNVFTDADHTKLNGIEASANVTDTANVVAALTAGSNITIASNGTIAGAAQYTHPTHPGDDAAVDTGALSGATVISDLDFNITTDTLGHVTDANATVATRNLTLANLGYTGATNANYITNNNQLTNGAGYTTYTSNQATNNNSTVTFTTVAAGTFNTTSDERTKKDIRLIENALDKVQQLGGYMFTFKHNDEKASGVIAQEVQKVMPELVQEGGEGHLTVQYGNMVGLLIEAIKEQQAQIDALTAKLNG